MIEIAATTITGSYRDNDRDDRRYVDRDWRNDGRYDRRYDGYNRRWDGRRWQSLEWVRVGLLKIDVSSF